MPYPVPLIAVSAAGLALACARAPAQSVRVFPSVQHPIEAGETVRVDVIAELSGFADDAAIAAFGFDVLGADDGSTIDAIGPATFDTFGLGSRPGVVAGNDLLRVVGGQAANVFGLHQGIITEPTVWLFSYTLTLAPDSAGKTVEIVASRADYRGGVVVYPDADLGRTLTAPAAVPLTLEPLTFTVGAPCVEVDLEPPLGQSDMFDLLEFLRRSDAEDPRADVDGSGVIDLADLVLFVEDMSRGC